MKPAGRWRKIGAMRHTKHAYQGLGEDPLVTRARRKETMRGAVKLFRMLMDAVDRHAAWAEAYTGMDPARLWALWELRQAPGLRAVDLAKAMAVHRNTAEELLHGLLASGLAAPLPGAGDASAGYVLTEAGRQLAHSIPDYGQGALMSALEQLPDASLEHIVEALRPLVEVLPFREDRSALKPLASNRDRAPLLPKAGRATVRRIQHADSN